LGLDDIRDIMKHRRLCLSVHVARVLPEVPVTSVQCRISNVGNVAYANGLALWGEGVVGARGSP